MRKRDEFLSANVNSLNVSVLKLALYNIGYNLKTKNIRLDFQLCKTRVLLVVTGIVVFVWSGALELSMAPAGRYCKSGDRKTSLLAKIQLNETD